MCSAITKDLRACALEYFETFKCSNEREASVQHTINQDLQAVITVDYAMRAQTFIRGRFTDFPTGTATVVSTPAPQICY